MRMTTMKTEPSKNQELADETRYVMSNTALMQQIKDSLQTHKLGTGYQPSKS